MLRMMDRWQYFRPYRPETASLSLPVLTMNPKYLAITCPLLLALFLFFHYRKNPLVTKAYIGPAEITLEAAVSPADKAKGLGGRETLTPGHGMIFAYLHKDRHPFWMLGMKFPLDFIWIADTVVVELTENVPVLTNGTITTVRPAAPVNKVIEVNAGTVKRLGIKVGDPVRIDN
jgi:uncharacterized membrane protein (UPF0127 family)